MQMIALPVIGLSGQVDAVTVWTGARTDPLPPPPNVGSIEWNASGVFTGTSAAQFLLRLSYADIPSVHTVPEILAGFDHWDDRAGFFDLFNLDNPADRWAGTATKTYEDGNPHRLHIAARASGCGITRTVRAIVCDVTDDEALVVPDLLSIAVRHMPIPPGHALGLVDLKTGFVHEWLADERTPLAGWRHHNPEIDNSGKLLVATTCIELATGVRQTANTKARLRFNPTDDWILLSARWNRINNGPRPQALIDVTPISPIPTPPVGKCRLCQDLLRHMDYRQAASTEGA